MRRTPSATELSGRALLLLAIGCGGETAIPPDASTDSSSNDATIEAGASFPDVLSPPHDAALLEADVYVPLDDGGGPFGCDNSTCNGTTQYCDTSSVGPPGPAYCATLPDGCVPANCECLPNANWGAGCSCEHATTGDGLVAGCQLP